MMTVIKLRQKISTALNRRQRTTTGVWRVVETVRCKLTISKKQSARKNKCCHREMMSHLRFVLMDEVKSI